jgi:colanic acid biosynthesis glycosyl transferase WcaI
MNIQLWSYNYAPEPTGIGPVSEVWAKAMQRRGHRVEVVAAHPHYPAPMWGRRLRPYREERDGVSLVRLPLWVGRATGGQRLRQELSYTAAQTLAAPFLPTPDVIVAVSPSFPALAGAMVNARLRRRPWVLWLQDILPDGAVETGLIGPGRKLDALRRFEAAVYRSAARIVVISETFEENLLRKGVPKEKLVRIYNPATRIADPRAHVTDGGGKALTMGNIGFSQGLVELVRAFEQSDDTAHSNAHLVITGDGVASDAVKAEIRSDRVQMPGLLSDHDLEDELNSATVAVVSQRSDIAEFNVPSKLMNFMTYGIPVVASVRPGSEVARLIQRSEGGWVTDSSQPQEFARTVAAVINEPGELQRRGRAGGLFAQEHFRADAAAAKFEELLRGVVS